MAKFEFKGSTEYIEKIFALKNDATGFIKRAVYDGADVVADEIRLAIESLPENDGKYVPGNGQIVGISAKQKQGLLDGLGLSKMRNDSGFINTSVGFEGYNDVVTKAYPNGQPNALIARSIDSGTSRRPKMRFISKAVNKSKARAEQAMADRFEADIGKIMEE